nr:hypothetical protein GCM10020063_091980 [Dactylosporangium thailandense]
MSEELIVGHELVTPCPRCGALLRGELSEAVDGDRLVWSTSWLCDGCGDRLESCDWGTLPDDYRRLLLDRDGVGRLGVDPGSGRPLRLAILRVLRRYGATLTEASDTYARLTGPGVIGTRAEVLLLAKRLDATGVQTQLDS